MLKGKIPALLLTLAVVAAVGYWTWAGLKSPPVAVPLSIVTTPTGWIKLDEGSFTLYAPSSAYLRKAKADNGLAYGDVVGVNGCVRYKAGPHVALVVDKARHPDFKDSSLVVDGHPAVLRKAVLSTSEQQFWFRGCDAPLYLGLYVQGVLPGGADLVVETLAPNEDALDDMALILKSVQFPSRP